MDIGTPKTTLYMKEYEYVAKDAESSKSRPFINIITPFHLFFPRSRSAFSGSPLLSELIVLSALIG